MEQPYNNQKKQRFKFKIADIFISVLILVLGTGIGFLFQNWNINESNIITVYILGVLMIAIYTSERIYSLVSSLISVLLFNFFFTEPYFSLKAFDNNYPITFIIMFIAAFLTSSLTVQIKEQARTAEETAYRTKILFDTNRLLSNETSREGIISVTCHQLKKLLNKDIIFYENDQQIEADTNCNQESQCLYLPIRIGEEVFGVVGVVLQGTMLEEFEKSISLSILGECALAMKNDRAQKEREEAALLAKNEQLRANLLRSISHDLRTPLTSISGNAGILLSNDESIEKERRKQIYSDIYEDSLWLINLVENLLSVTRFENGTIKLRLNSELLDEIMGEALQHIDRKSSEHTIHMIASEELIIVKVEARLIMQVVINLVDNAIKYTPVNSNIYVETRREGNEAVVIIADDGDGIPEESKGQIFDMFYTANTKVVDSRRSMGLGLALCKAIVTAHGGSILVRDHKPKGAEFEFRLPIEEVATYE
ncbi:MAG: DUF4118 domain-containing protein [Lachnospiraceae bacterium]|nr:DUF4118 domain-containing protein [Lachnospiraceae bacterium]